ncbi:hypothetical protein EDB19DRAFT_1905801 [Suillus lakei]|nr:hypothetical protein EDB19DRAFT_1905801 [Suillus lakei]
MVWIGVVFAKISVISMSKVATRSGKTPTPLPTRSAWAKGPPPSSSSSVASPIATSHSRRPSASGQGVFVKDGVSVPRNNVGSVVRPASVVFGSIDDAPAPLSSSLPKSSRADIAKLFQNPSSSSSQPSSDTSSPSTRPSNLPPHHQPSSSSSQQPQQPSQLGTHSYSQFVPSNIRQPQQPSGTPRSPTFPHAVQNVQGQSWQGAGPGGPGGPPIPASPRMASHPHQAPPGGMGQQVPMQPMQWSEYYYMDPYNQPQPPWGYYAMSSQHMHQQPHPQHVPHAAPLHQPGPLPMSPPPATPQPPGTPTMAHAIPHPPHTPQLPPSISSPPPTPSTTNAPRLITNARDFVTGGGSANVTIKSQDGMEVTLDALEKHSPQPPTVLIPPASPIVTSRRQHSVSVRIESEETKRTREENARNEQEKKGAVEHTKEAIKKKKKKEKEKKTKTKKRKEEEGAPLCIGGFQKPSVPSGFQMGNFPSPGSKLTSEERFARSNPRSASTSSATSQFCSPMAATARATNVVRSVVMQTRHRCPIGGRVLGFGVAPFLGAGFEPGRTPRIVCQPLGSCEYNTQDQLIHWANKSVDEKDGRTLIQVIRLVFERATDEAAWSEMYARLCRKMMEQISPEVQDDEIKNSDGKPIAGGQLFRKYLLNRCQGGLRARVRRVYDEHATKAANDKKGTEEAELCSEEYYAAQKMLTKRIMHECVKKLFGNVENPEEEEIESLCQLLKTVGQLLDTPTARAHMDVYFTRMKELGKSLNVSSRMQFMLQDVIELRDRKWVSRTAVAAPTDDRCRSRAIKEKATAEKGSFNRQMSMSCSGSRCGGDYNQEHGPDGWVVAGGPVLQAPPEAGDLSQLGKITEGPAIGMVMDPSGVFAAGKNDNKREALSQMNSSSNMFDVLSQNSALATEASTKPSRSSSRKSSVDLDHAGVPEPAVRSRELQLLPRSVLVEDNILTPVEDECGSIPTTMSEADVKTEIDRHVKEFFEVRNVEEADVYFTNLPHELCFRLVDNHQIRTSGGGPRPGGEDNKEPGPDGWAAAGGSVPWAPPKAGDLSQFGKISSSVFKDSKQEIPSQTFPWAPPEADDLSQFGKISMGTPMVMGPSSVFADSKRETPSQTNSSLNMAHMPGQNPEPTPVRTPT